MNECEHNFLLPVEEETEEDIYNSDRKIINKKIIQLACVKCAVTISLTHKSQNGFDRWNEENTL